MLKSLESGSKNTKTYKFKLHKGEAKLKWGFSVWKSMDEKFEVFRKTYLPQ